MVNKKLKFKFHHVVNLSCLKANNKCKTVEINRFKMLSSQNIFRNSPLKPTTNLSKANSHFSRYSFSWAGSVKLDTNEKTN